MRECSRIIIVRDGRMLLIHRFKGGREFWVAPGGTMEAGETPEQTALRETKEEASFDVGLGERLFVIDDERQRTHYFAVKEFSGIVKLGGEEAEQNCPENEYVLEWVPLERMGTIVFFNEATTGRFRDLAHRSTW